MIDLLAVPPALIGGVIIILVWVLPRSLGQGVGTLLFIGLLVWIWLLPTDTGLSVWLLGAERVLVTVDQTSRVSGLVFALGGALGLATGIGHHVPRSTATLGAAMGTVALWIGFAGDWLVIAIGWLILPVISTLLLWTDDGGDVRTGYRLAIAHGIGSGALLAGIAFHAATIEAIRSPLPISETGLASGPAALAVGVAIGIAVAVPGVQEWFVDGLKQTSVAISLFLLTTIPIVGLIVAVRSFPDGQFLLLVVGSFLIIAGAGRSIILDEPMAVLGHLLQAHFGIVLVAIGAGGPLGRTAGLSHILAIVLGFGILLIIPDTIHPANQSLGSPNDSRIVLWRPRVTISFVVGAAIAVGVPGFIGFQSLYSIYLVIGELNLVGITWILYLGILLLSLSLARFGHWILGQSFRGTNAVDQTRSWIAFTLATAGVGISIRGWFQPELVPGLAISPISTVDPLWFLIAIGLITGGIVGYVLFGRIIERFKVVLDIDQRVRIGAVRIAFSTAMTCRWMATRLDTMAKQFATHGMQSIRRPAESIEQVLRPRWRKRYRDRYKRTSGATGTKLGLDASVYILILTVVVLLILGFR